MPCLRCVCDDVEMVVHSLHDELTLYETPTEYRLEPIVRTSETRALSLDRGTGDILLLAPNTTPLESRSPRTIYGVLGILSLSACDYLVLITGRERRGLIFGHIVYRATDFAVLPIAPPPVPDHPAERHLLALVRTHLKTGAFWFSYGWDLTTRLQNQQTDDSRPLWEQATDRFFWNKYLHTRLIDITQSDSSQDCSPYILPVIYGSFDIRPATIHNNPFLFCLISRRSRYRAGTRYFSRGIDAQGNVANFNETEQLVLVTPPSSSASHPPDVFSYIQLRGSVPLFWAEINTLRYRPDLQIMDVGATQHALRAHLTDLKSNYGDVVLVNLVNQVGYEMPVKDAFERAIEEVMDGSTGLTVGGHGRVEGIGYEYFDFHKECKGMRWDRINLLVDRLQDRLDAHGWFHVSASSTTPVQTQRGAVRTNCMDCLDRTNVVQSTIARGVLEKQLRAVGILESGEGIEATEFLPIFRNAWADHADYVSNGYAGSGALKADFTRTGVRTKGGAARDGINSVTRYLKNNYFDGPRQDAFDLMTGSWVARRTPSLGAVLLVDKRPLLIRSMPHVAGFSIFMILAGLTLPRTSEYSLVYYHAIWFLFLLVSIAFIQAHGTAYVAWPRLNASAVRDVLEYDGPGYRSTQHGRGVDTKRGGVKMGHVGSEQGSVGRMEEVEMGERKKRVE
ncbi:putative recessive suppressor of secretory defect protein [Rhizoctonia solani 123E]|uniref:Putative recessive suppressor of secretory defect protein n=1 Tax=Rhizoctonia solani 123E TaxID=1423351 RepID=A0A074RPN2_9AGAM|nr:putative recessive suppressor of secretory defect protein [Rhizoctonia solani 123E]